MPCYWEDDSFDFDKFYIGSDEKSRCKELFGRMPDIEVIDREKGFYECIPRGHSKATAIDLVLKHYGISKEDAYVLVTAAMICPCSSMQSTVSPWEITVRCWNIYIFCNKNSRG